MNIALIGQLLSLAIPAFIGLGNFFKGKKKWVYAILAYFIIKWAVEKAALEAAKNSAQDKIDPATGDPIVPTYYNPNTLAERYRRAFDPYGTGWLSYNGTDTEKLYELAGITYDFAAVRTAYKTLYKSDLYDDLKSELSNDELDAFNTILNRKL